MAESVAAGEAESVAAGVEVSVAAGVAVSVAVVVSEVVVSSVFFWQPARAIDAEAITRINAVFFMCVSYISLNVPDWLSGCTNTPAWGALSIEFPCRQWVKL